MRNRFARFLAGGLFFLALLVVVAVAIIEIRSRRTFDAPLPAIAASTDPAIVAKGRYIAYSTAACAYCHVPRQQWTALDKAELPLSGNHVFPLPFGQLISPNITPDPETGIGRRTDGELARILRYGVRADGRAAFPLMAFHDMSDEDLTAVISFLRSQPPVRQEVPGHRLSLLGKVLMAFAIVPRGPTSTPPKLSPPGPSVERGEYLATRISSCVECHTDRDPRNGEFVGPKFGGGQRMDLAADSTRVAVPPNLTPDPKTSPIGLWSEDVFVGRFRMGETLAGTPMPWGAYARMTEEDLRSIYRYLRSLPPYEHATGPGLQQKTE
jgi:mono/diheme cytochrome c family protein